MQTDPLLSPPPLRPPFQAIVTPGRARATGSGEYRVPVLPGMEDLLRTRRMDDAQRDVLLGLVRDALESGHPDRALSILDRLWSAELTREDCWYLRGQALYELKRFTEAGEVAGQGLARVPRSVALLYLLSNCELKLHNLPGAERALLEAIDLMPGQPVLLCRYAEMLTQAGRYDDAGRMLERAALASPEHPLVIQEQAALDLARAGAARGEPMLEDRGDLYGRAPLGLSLLAGPGPARPDGVAKAPGEGLVLLRWGLVGAAVVLAVLGFRLFALAAFATALAAPRLWRGRG